MAILSTGAFRFAVFPIEIYTKKKQLLFLSALIQNLVKVFNLINSFDANQKHSNCFILPLFLLFSVVLLLFVYCSNTDTLSEVQIVDRYPRHSPHVDEQIKPFFLQHRILEQPVLQLHDIIFNSSSGAQGRSVYFRIIILSVIFHPHLVGSISLPFDCITWQNTHIL